MRIVAPLLAVCALAMTLADEPPIMVQDYERPSSAPSVWVVNIPNENASVRLSSDQPFEAKQCAAVRYRFTSGGPFQYLGIPNKVRILAPIRRLRYRIRGDGSHCSYGVQISDVSGETHQYGPNTGQGGVLDFTGWREVVIGLAENHETWGGDKNGKLDYPITALTFTIGQPKEPGRAAVEGEVAFDAVSVESTATAAETLGIRIEVTSPAYCSEVRGPTRIAVALRVSARRGPRPYRVPVAAEDVLGPEQWARVPLRSRFVLVVFVDYCCPACKDAVRRAAALVSGQPGRIVLCVRNYPLSVDRRARELALFVEAAKFQGSSRTAISALPDACGRTRAPLRDLARRLGLDWPRLSRDMAGVASRTVAQDERDGRALGIRGTPALFLCCPDGSVYRLRAPEQAQRILPKTSVRSQAPPWAATSPGTPRPSGTGEIAQCTHA